MVESQCTFQILKWLSKQVIVGSDFLGKHNALIDFREATIRIGKQVFSKGKGNSSTPGCYLVKTLGKTELKSQTSNLVPSQVSSRVPAGIYLARMIDTTEGLHVQPGMSIARTIWQLTASQLDRQFKVFNFQQVGSQTHHTPTRCQSNPRASNRGRNMQYFFCPQFRKGS